jgi:hypothetical protein
MPKNEASSRNERVFFKDTSCLGVTESYKRNVKKIVRIPKNQGSVICNISKVLKAASCSAFFLLLP